MRNEERNLSKLYKCLHSQIYPSNKLEFVIVNDHSTDNTWDLLNEWKLDNLQLLNMPKENLARKMQLIWRFLFLVGILFWVQMLIVFLALIG